MLGTMEQRTEGMKKQAQELIEQAYQSGFKDGQGNTLAIDSEKFIEQGRDEAWEAARKLMLSSEGDGGLPNDIIEKIFNGSMYYDVLKNCSASEAIEKIRKYEEKKQEEEQEIRVGDEVILNEKLSFEPNKKAIVISEGDHSWPYNVMFKNGDTNLVSKIDIGRKTGRTFPEIVEVLKKMQEENNG